jgi:ATP-dependent RNA helicase DDX24/MAK5
MYSLEEIDPVTNTVKTLVDFDMDNFVNVDDFKEDKEQQIKDSILLKLKKSKISKASKASKQEREGIKEWKSLHHVLGTALQNAGFKKPTNIQEKVIKAALQGRDVIACAPTGSGKTYAYALPILDHILQEEEKGMTGLILAPTRELALQVQEHLKKLKLKVHIACVLGGMSQEKQMRILKKGPQILVATPGRLCEIMENDQDILINIFKIKFLVIDEADRMLQNGHFQDLSKILDLISPTRSETVARQTFLLSATMVDKQAIFQNMSRNSKNVTTLQDIVQKINFSDDNPHYINLSSKDIINQDILETKVDCLVKEKDSVLYYILTIYTGRTIVFVNSIDAIRRLIPLFTLLGLPVYPLHAEMQQKQRLKNFERFKSNSSAVLIATDVAARGLDIPDVKHVIHYQLPRSIDLYVHRSGRTARANKNGISVMLCSPEQLSIYKKICFHLGKEKGVPSFPIDRSFMTAINFRISLARKIDEMEHQVRKTENEKNWFSIAAQEADIELDDHIIQKQENPKEGIQKRISIMKAQLKGLLTTKIIPKGISTKYLTSNSDRQIVDILLETKGIFYFSTI